jgi:hypothetical protein
MSKLARKLVLSVLTVVLTVAALGTTTFAWFTLTNTTVIQPFEVTVTESTGFQMAIGNPVLGQENLLDWVNILVAEDIEAYIVDTYGTLRLNAVTTADGINFFSVDMNASTGTGSGFLELPINFRSEQELQIQWTNVTFPGTTFLWEADQPFVTAKGQPVISGDDISIFPADSVRIAIVGNVPTVGYELPNSVTNVVLTGGTTPLDLSYLTTIGDGLGAQGNLNYYANKNGGNLPVGANAVTVLETITALNNEPIFDLEASTTSGQAFYGKVMIRIWIEGWDANMYDAVLSSVISLGFSFAGVEV